MNPSGKTIVVFGSSQARPRGAKWTDAYRLGLALGEAGYGVANGGYGGTMEAASRGAREAGAATIGVTCDVWKSTPNGFLDREIRTADLHERLRTLLELGDGYIALPGGTGTLVELAMVWEFVAKRLAPERPIVCLGPFWQPLLAVMEGSGARRGPWLTVAEDVPGVLAFLEGFSDGR